jgi:ubiquinone/menaquinone biosynthesis C-methylase UbiE
VDRNEAGRTPDAEPEPGRVTSERFDETFSRVDASPRLNELFEEVMGPFPPHVEPFSMVTRDGLERVFSELQVHEDGHLVDLCCGRGGIGLWFAERSGARLTGVDFSPEAIGQAQRRAELFPGAKASFLVADAAQTTLGDGSADAIVCIDSLQLLPGQDMVVREMARLLRPGGRAVLTTWERDDPGISGRTPIRDAGRLVESNGLRLTLREEHPEWMDRQTAMFERVIAEDRDDAEPAVRRLAEEGRAVLPLTATSRRVLVVAAADAPDSVDR